MGREGASKPGTRRLICTTRAVMAGLVQVEPGHDDFGFGLVLRAYNRTSFPGKPALSREWRMSSLYFGIHFRSASERPVGTTG
jgi:hypothetical protein